jgi:sugar lactone lactonase YvrE
MRILKNIAIALAVLVALLAAALYARYGGGREYVDLNTPPALPAAALEVAAQYPEPIGNIAVSADGRLFFTVHPESRPQKTKLVEWRDGKPQPYPSDAAQSQFETPLGLAIDAQQRLWVIDHGNHATGRASLKAFDLKTGAMAYEQTFGSDIAPLGSFLQDLRVSPDGNTVVIADVSFWRKAPALVVVDVASMQSRRVLDKHASVLPQDWIIRNPIKKMVFFGGLVALKPGVDGVTITPDGQWVAYAAMAHDRLYRVALADLRDASLSADQLAARVQDLGPKPLNDGMSSDSAGNLLLTDVEHQSVVRWRADTKTLQTLFRDARIRWSDGLSHGPDGWLYLADSAIPDQMLRSKAHIASRAPYTVWRIKTDVPGVAGQ